MSPFLCYHQYIHTFIILFKSLPLKYLFAIPPPFCCDICWNNTSPTWAILLLLFYAHLYLTSKKFLLSFLDIIQKLLKLVKFRVHSICIILFVFLIGQTLQDSYRSILNVVFAEHSSSQGYLRLCCHLSLFTFYFLG